MVRVDKGRRAFLRVAGGFAVAPLLAGCVYFSSGVTYRFRMTVHVDTPAGPRSGSSVIEVTHYPNGTSPTRMQGEAVAVDLPGGQTLFVLLGRGGNPSAAAAFASLAYGTLARSGPDGWREEAEFIKGQTRPATLKAQDFPSFVRYRNPADARTIELVDPSNLSAGFGPGIRLNRVEIQTTQDPVTSTIARRMPNFGDGSGWSEWWRQLPHADPRAIGPEEFRYGF